MLLNVKTKTTEEEISLIMKWIGMADPDELGKDDYLLAKKICESSESGRTPCYIFERLRECG